MSTARKLSQDVIALTIPADLNYLKVIRRLTLDVAYSARIPEEEADDLSLAIIEAVTNSIRHSKCASLTVSFNVDASAVTARIADNGCGFEFSRRKCRFPAVDKPGGRGLPLMNNLVDSFAIDTRPGCGCEVTLVKKLKRRAKAPRAKVVPVGSRS